MPIPKDKLEAILNDPEFLQLPENEQDSFLDEMSQSQPTPAIETALNVIPGARGMQVAADIYGKARGGVQDVAGNMVSRPDDQTLTAQMNPLGAFASVLAPAAPKPFGLGLLRPEFKTRRDAAGEVAGQIFDAVAIPGVPVGAKRAATRAGEIAVEGLVKQTPQKLIGRAEKLTTEILQPQKARLQDYLRRGEQLPSVREAARAVKKAKDYGQLRNTFKEKISGVMGARNSKIEQTNAPVGREYTGELKKLIQDTERGGQATPQEIGDMRKVLSRELRFLRKNKDFDKLKAQERKEFLQDLTERLLERRESGETIITQPARYQAIDKLRGGLKKAVESGDPEITRLNSQYGGLSEAVDLAAGQQALAQKDVPPTFLENILSFIKWRPRDIAGEFTARASKRQNELPQVTKKIEGLVKLAEKRSKRGQ
jgi:hypothetical protein